jgi:hydrogenase nickel incorporation protein HypA/HybF
MHEMSLARRLFQQVVSIAAQHGGASVLEVRIALGAFAGFEPILLASAFEQLVRGTIAENARLEIETIPLDVRCQRCQNSFSPESLCFVCPRCGCRDVQIVRGEETLLESVSLVSA